MQYLPSKKFLVVVLAVLIVLGLGFLASYKSNSNNDNNSSGKFSYISSLFKGNDKDSDNDGLKDWEETLWKTNPKNSDSDGDGTLDGEEVNLGRDPLKPGPDDRLEDLKNLIVEKNDNSESGGLSKTDTLARQFFSSFMALYQTGNLNDQSKEYLTQPFLDRVNQEQITDKYKTSDLKIINNTTKEFFKKYGNDTAAIINKYNSMIKEDETLIIKKALTEENESYLQNLDYIINLYQDASQKLLKLEVPNDAISMHLKLINSVYNLSISLENIKKIFQDPITGIIGMSQYQREYTDVASTMQNLRDYFLSKEIGFTSAEEGYIFTSGR